MMNMKVGIVEQHTKKKGKNECFRWNFLKKFIVENDDRVLNVFALVVYSLVIFPSVPENVEAVLVDLIKKIGNQANPVPTILAETIQSLN